MSDVKVIRYDPDANESVAVRRALLPPLRALAQGWDRGRLTRSDVDLFNSELVGVLQDAQEDRELTVRYLMELLLAVDRGAHCLAAARGIRCEQALTALLGPDQARRRPIAHP